MGWKQIRECDGACCRADPRFPTKDGKSCIYLDVQPGQKHCRVMRGEVELRPRRKCPAIPRLTEKQAYEQTCLGWPHNFDKRRDDERCCWRWVEEDGN